MNRLAKMFQTLGNKSEGALMCYLPTIGPDLTRSLEIADAFRKGGVDYIELSIPCVYPWLDGSAMQKHHLESLTTYASVDSAFDLGREVRSRYPDWPILPMAFYSAVISYGVDRFVRKCREIEADGVEIPDYPAFADDDPHSLREKLHRAGVAFITFCDGISMAPRGSREYELLCKLVRGTVGFMFLTATPGVTGARKSMATEYLTNAVRRLREVQDEQGVNFPIMLGFGLSTPEHVSTAISKIGVDAVVVGSAVSRHIHAQESAEELAAFVRTLKQATRRK